MLKDIHSVGNNHKYKKTKEGKRGHVHNKNKFALKSLYIIWI